MLLMCRVPCVKTLRTFPHAGPMLTTVRCFRSAPLFLLHKRFRGGWTAVVVKTTERILGAREEANTELVGR